MKINRKRILILFFSLAIAATGSWFLFVWDSVDSEIIAFDLKRDGKDIMAIFDRDWDWLIPGDRDSFSPELMLAYQAPMQNPMYAGRLKIKVIRDGDNLVGFVAWYMKDPEKGFLNFVVVNPEYRGKGYADKLVRHAMDQMIKEGAKKLTMVTWPYNVRARKVYDRLGWKVVKEEYQVHYEYDVK